jgi:hypothetical protein
MKQIIKFGLMLTVATTGFLFTGCGEDGDPGVAGDQGEQGDKGDTGDTGAHGVGYDEAVQYGNVVVQYTGTRPDNVAFNETVDYKYAPLGTGDGEGTSLLDNSSGYADGDYSSFRVGRFVGSVDDYYAQSRVIINFERYPDEGEVLQFQTYSLNLDAAFTTSDYKYFKIQGNFSGFVSTENYSDYSYTPETGSLKFKINVTIPAEDNDTRNELTVSVTVDVKVFQNVETPR